MRLVTASLMLAVLSAAPAIAREDKPFEGVTVTAVAGIDAVRTGDVDTNLLYGGQVGYDRQSGSSVYGIEAEAAGRTRSGCYTVAQPYYRTCDRGGRDFYVGGRVGTTVGTSTLLYAKAGYTNRRETFDYSTTATGPTTFGRSQFDGFRLGAGLEQKLGSALSLKAEYRFSSYGRYADRHQFVAGLGVRF